MWPGPNGSVPDIFLGHLKAREPEAQFEFFPPDRIQSSSGALYYVKTGAIPKHIKFKDGETKLVQILRDRAPGLTPKVIASGSFTRDDAVLGHKTYRTYFLYEGEELRPIMSTSAQTLAQRLAEEIHSYQGPHGFGIYNPTRPGPNQNGGGVYSSWRECYDALIACSLSRLVGSRYGGLCSKGKEIRERVIPKLLNPKRLKIRPVLIHGNLWRNHWVADVNEDEEGEPVACNPAPMFAHNEFDNVLGILPASFYKTYHQYFPKSDPVDEYDLRLDLYLLFYYLNHIVMFGGRYTNLADQMMDKLLRKFPPKSVRFAPACEVADLFTDQLRHRFVGTKPLVQRLVRGS